MATNIPSKDRIQHADGDENRKPTKRVEKMKNCVTRLTGLLSYETNMRPAYRLDTNIGARSTLGH